jgi:hypothetical protein
MKRNDKYLKENKDKSYLKEFDKYTAINDLNRIKYYIDRMLKLCNHPRQLDDETKQNIIDMSDFVIGIINDEFDKELKKQKKEGKQFLSNEDIDQIFKNVI